jgi:hypothetical protein
LGIKLLFIILGGTIGALFTGRKQFSRGVNLVAFWLLLPAICFVEFSSVQLEEWYYFPAGSAFVLCLYWLGRIIGWDKHKSALLATAEGGTLGFVLYVLIGSEPISKFFVIDMFGNGIMLFTFIYFQLSRRYDFKKFARNPLVIMMAIGFALNLGGVHLKHFESVAWLEEVAVHCLLGLIAFVICAGMERTISAQILISSEFRTFWLIRLTCFCASLAVGLPLALTILFLLPPSFLMPVIYTAAEDAHEKAYAINFIAVCLPVFAILASAFLLMQVFLRTQ